MPLYDTLPVYNRVITSKKKAFIMANTINALIFVAGIVAAVCLALQPLYLPELWLFLPAGLRKKKLFRSLKEMLLKKL